MSTHLQLIGGVVSGLSIHAGEEEFVLSAGQQAAGVSAAAGLALEGMTGAAAGAGMAASYAGDSVEFFTCKIGEQPVQGRFSKVTFKDGDALEMVLATQLSGWPLVLAARRSSDRVLWMTPHCSRGESGHRHFSMGMAGKLLVAFLCGGMAFIVLMQYLHDQTALIDWFAMTIVAGMAAIAAPYYAFRFYRQWLPVARQAEQIFAALGYPDPTRVDLPRDHKRYCKSKGIGWPYTVNNGADAGPWTYHYLEPQGSRATQ